MANEKSNKSGINKRRNKDPGDIDRGFELMLRKKGRDLNDGPKTLNLKFGKMVALFRREFHFHFELSFNIRKQ